MKTCNFALTGAELEALRHDLKRNLPRKWHRALDRVEFDPDSFIRNRETITPGTPAYPFMAGMRDAGEFSFAAACRLHSLHYRWYPGLGVGDGIRVFEDTAMSDDRLFCREDLIGELRGLLNCGVAEAVDAFFRLFGGHADLETKLLHRVPFVHLAVPDPPLPLPDELRDSDAWRTFDSVFEELPEEWYIHLQIPDGQLDLYRWVIREHGSRMYRVIASGEPAADRVRELRRERGNFLQRNPESALRRLWKDSGVWLLDERRIKREVFMLGACQALGIGPSWRFCAGE